MPAYQILSVAILLFFLQFFKLAGQADSTGQQLSQVLSVLFDMAWAVDRMDSRTRQVKVYGAERTLTTWRSCWPVESIGTVVWSWEDLVQWFIYGIGGRFPTKTT